MDIVAVNGLRWWLHSLTFADTGSTPSVMPAYVSGDTTTLSYYWDSVTNTIDWHIPGNVAGGNNYYLTVYLYTDCRTAVSGGKITTTYVGLDQDTITSNIYLPSITVPGLSVKFLNPGSDPPNIRYAAPNDSATEVLQICAEADFSTSYLYGFTLQTPANATDSASHSATKITLSKSYPYTNKIVINSSSPHLFKVTPADIDTLLGQDYISPTGCIYASFYVPTDTCTTSPNQNENFLITIPCNANIPSNIGIGTTDISTIESAGVCAPDTFDDKIWVTDNGSQYPLAISLQFIEDSVVVPGIDVCNEPFTLSYNVVNSTMGNTILFQHANEKYLTAFSVYVDTNWIDTSGTVFRIYYGSSRVMQYSFSNGTLSFSLTSHSLDDNSSADIQIRGLIIRPNPSPILAGIVPAPVGPACMPPTDNPILGPAIINYKTECGEVRSASTNTFTNTTISLSASGQATGTFGPAVSPGISALLTFNWSQSNIQAANPWKFTATTDTSTTSFFTCTDVSYRAYLSLPIQLALTDSTLSYVSANGNTTLNLHYLGMTADSNIIWYSDTLPGPGLGNDTVSTWVVLGDCSAFAAGGEVVPTLSLYASCKDGTCNVPYCFETVATAVYIHCSGSCGGTGIGTHSLVVSNYSYPGLSEAYACDLVDFKVVGVGFVGASPTPTPANMTGISVQLSYLDAGGSNGNIFNISKAAGYLTYAQKNGPTRTADTANYTITGDTLINSQWVMTATITGISDLVYFQSYRACGDTFTINWYMPVACTLPYNNLNEGLYNLNGITANLSIQGVDSTGGDTLSESSCDPASANFVVISHHYGTAINFSEPLSQSGPCNQTLTIVDSAIGGIASDEMPYYIRPLVEWPSGTHQPNGGLTITFPPNMGITGISYYDSSGNTYSNQVVYDSTTWNGTDSVTTVYGFKTGNTYYWPDYSKEGSEFLRKLVVNFAQSSCGNEEVVVSLPHQTQDGKTSAECISGCSAWIIKKDTIATPYDSLANAPVISLTTPGTNINGVIIDPLLSQTFTVPLLLNNSTGLSSRYIYISPSDNVTPVATLSVDSNGIPTVFTVDSPGQSAVYASIPGSVPLEFQIDLNNCINQTIELPIGYTCSGLPNGGNFCAENNSAFISVIVREPNINIENIHPDSSRTFPDCKGICDGDERTLTLTIYNSGPNAGPAYNPVLTINNIGPGDLDLAEISMKYATPVGNYPPSNGGSANITFQTGVYTPSFTFPLSGLNLPEDSFSHNPFLLPGDSVNITIHLFGDGNNCSPYAILQTSLRFTDVCGHVEPVVSLPSNFNFNLTVCPDTSCVKSSCAGNQAYSVCNQCELAPPVVIEPVIHDVNTGCSGDTASGSILLNVSGGPAIFNPTTGGESAPNYTYFWSTGDTTKQISNLAAGTYKVTVSTGSGDYNCSVTAVYTVNNSAIITTTAQSNPTCAANNGSIHLIVSGVSGDSFTYSWSNGSTASNISGLGAGTYIATIGSTLCGSSVKDTVILTTPASNMFIGLSVLNVNCPGNPGRVQVNEVNGATVPYYYQWDYHDSTGAQISNLGAGTYSVTVTDNNQCTGSATATITDTNSPPQLGTFSMQTQNMCAGSDEPITITATGFAGSTCIVRFKLLSTNGVNQNGYAYGRDTVSFNQYGVGTLIIPAALIHDNFFTVIIDTISVSGNSTCFYSFAADSACLDNAAHFSTQQVYDYYFWQLNGVSIGNHDTVCLGHTETLEFYVSYANGPPQNGPGFVWNVRTENSQYTTIYGYSGHSITQTPADTGTYIYKSTYTYPNTPCSLSDSFILHVNGVHASIDTPIVCASNPTFQLRANPANQFTYRWSSSIDTLDTVTYNTPYLPSTYTVTVTDASHCSASATRTIYPDSVIVNITAPVTTTCSVIPVTFTANASGPDSRNPYNYRWNNGDSTQIITDSLSAPYTVVVTVTDFNNCSATDTIKAGSLPAISLVTFSGSICNGAAIKDTVSGTYNYRWSNGAANTDSIGNLSQGEYRVTVSSLNGCSATDSAFVTASTTGIVITFSTHYSCAGDVPRDTIYTHVSGGDSSYSYSWGNGSTSSFIIDTLMAQRGIDSVKVTDGGGCSATALVVIPSYSPLSVSLVPHNSSCGGSIINLPSGGLGGYTYSWNNDSVTQSLFNVGPGFYSLTLTDGAGCSVTATDSLTDSGPFSVSLDTTRVTCFGFADGSVTAMVSGGQHPYSYLWSDSLTGSMISGLRAGTYVVTVTDNNACTATALAHVNQPDSISIVLTTTQPNCGLNNGSILATVTGGTPGYTYFYNVYAPGSQTPHVTGLWGNSTGQSYTLFITDTLGCTAQKSDTLYNNIAPLTVYGQPADGSCSGATGSITLYTVTGGTAPYHYHWSNGDTTRNIANLVPGTYGVTVTDTMNCAQSIGVTVNRNYASCCFTDSVGISGLVTVDTNTNSSALTIVPGEDIYIGAHVTLTVNNNLNLTNCDVVLGPGAQIVVDSGGTLNLKGTTIHGCDTLWYDVEMKAHSHITTDSSGGKRSAINDAMYGVNINPGVTTMSFKNTDFFRNQFCMFVETYNATPQLNISNCEFSMGGSENLLPAPRPFTNYNHTQTAISISYTDSVMIPNPIYSGLPNTFKNINNAINTNASYVYVYKNKFDSIYDYEHGYGYGFDGMAVVGNGESGQTMRQGIVVQTASAIPDTTAVPAFKNCNQAVHLSFLSGNINYNRMENVNYGVYARYCPSKIINVHANYINNTAYGVSLINNSSANQVIDSNTIYVYPVVEHYGYIDTEWVYNPNAHDLFLDSVYGHIYAKTYGVSETEITPSATKINANTIYRGLNCIELNNTFNTRVGNNQLHLANDSAVKGNQAGLYAVNCHNILVSDNTIDGDAAQYVGAPDTLSVIISKYRKAGISLYNTHSGNLCSNVLGGATSNKGLGYGMLYAGDCNAVDLYSNTINKSGYGLTLLTSGIGGVIKSQGVFDSTYQNNDFVGTFTNTDASYSFIYSNNYPRPRFYFLNGQSSSYSPANNGSNVSQDEITFRADSIGTTELCELVHSIGPQGGDGFARILAVDSGVYYMVRGIDSIAANWLAEKTMYESLYGDTATLNNDSLMAAFYARIDTTDRGLILQSELQNQLLTDSATLADTTVLGGKPSGYADALSYAKTLTTNIPTENIQAVNYKAMSNIYLQMITTGIDTFTNGQKDTIGSLAVQCPYIAGDAVYMARALYSQIDNGTFFNDLTICQLTSPGSERMLAASRPADTTASVTAIPLEFVNLYPNPAKQIINLSFYAQTIGLVQFELIDQLGQPVMKQNLGNGQNFAQFSTGSFSNGLYYWRLMDSKRIIKAGKVAIMK